VSTRPPTSSSSLWPTDLPRSEYRRSVQFGMRPTQARYWAGYLSQDRYCFRAPPNRTLLPIFSSPGRSQRSGRFLRIRYGVVGLGHIAQVAVLPAFADATNSELTASISDDETKLRELGRRYHVPHTYSYEQYDQCLAEGSLTLCILPYPTACIANTRNGPLALVFMSCAKNQWP
jgi:hypothetical protein